MEQEKWERHTVNAPGKLSRLSLHRTQPIRIRCRTAWRRA